MQNNIKKFEKVEKGKKDYTHKVDGLTQADAVLAAKLNGIDV